MTAGLVAAIVAAVAAPLLAYIGAARRLSGRIGTSEASELWKESASMRADYRKEIASLNQTIDRLRERLGAVEARNRELLDETIDLKRQLGALTP